MAKCLFRKYPFVIVQTKISPTTLQSRIIYNKIVSGFQRMKLKCL